MREELTLGDKVRMEGMSGRKGEKYESSEGVYRIITFPKTTGRGNAPETFSTLIQYESTKEVEEILIRDHLDDIWLK
jgi:hypothetical protein